ncbi:MAG: class I SAM-dependent methyltransferase [Streptosporangiaceae bacterium]|jgi:SAM-dependent methyltransferase
MYRTRVLPRITNLVMKSEDHVPIRRRVCEGLSGEVVEIGFGSGLNVPFYPASVVRVRAIDPATLGQRLAAARLSASRIPVEFAGLDGQSLPIESESADHVLSTWTLCTIPDVPRALAEVRRVLRPGGELHFVEHGLSPDPSVAAWQHRLNPLHRMIFGGCHLDRPILALLDSSGLRVDQLDHYYVPGLKVLGYTSEGLATKTGLPPALFGAMSPDCAARRLR